MAAKLRPRVSLPRSCRARPTARLKPAAVSFSGLLCGRLLANDKLKDICTF
jgi:hypothetical protein